MPLSAGTKLGAYEIIALIGAGGMGEVYRARDTKLDRDVAIKILPDAVAQDPDRLTRFTREAKVLASLNHPLIAAIYGVEDRALVMELVEGESPKGPMSFEKAWKIARQIADALDYAHEKGVVHRDLKPDNVKVTPEGVVKLLDFGLAKAFQNPVNAASGDPSQSPTATVGATVAGAIAGTAAYMAPEQAQGKRVDERTDIWAWGVVLYELLTGARLFKGETVADTLANVLTKEPDLGRVPPQVRRLLRACLEKDAKHRLRAIGDAHQLLDQPSAATRPPSRLQMAGWAAGAALLGALAGVSVLRFRSAPPPEPMHLSIALPGNAEGGSLSPDGSRLAMSIRAGSKYQLWIRPLNSSDLRLLVSEEAQAPFWSPDSRLIGFFGDGKLKIIPATGGPPQTLCNAEIRGGGTWSAQGVILYAPGSAIFRVSATGGPCTAVTKSENGSQLFSPQFLPDGRHFLYTESSVDAIKGGVYLASLDGSINSRILADQSGVVYVPPMEGGKQGYLLFVRENTLMAQPFNARTLQADGDLLTVAPQASTPSVSGNRLLVYLSNGLESRGSQLTWFDRSGKNVGEVGSASPPRATLRGLALSPDEKMVAFSRREPGQSGAALSVYDLARNAQRRLVASAQSPVWAADESGVVFERALGSSAGDLYWEASNGGGPEELLLKNGNPKYPSDFSRDGRFLVYTEIDPKNRADIWILPDPLSKSSERKPFPFLQTPFLESQGQLSPDSRWIAYVSFESGQREVYVRPFPSGEGKWQVSTNGGHQPRWGRDGRELFYLEGISPRNRLMSVPVQLGAHPAFGSPKPLFDVLSPTILPQFNSFVYSPSADGQRFLVNTVSSTAQPTLDVLVNWTASLKK